MNRLSRFQIDLLVAVAENRMGKGLMIKEHIESRYDCEVLHGRMYPNLDELDQMGLIKKHPNVPDKRTNAYEITTDGIQTLEELEETIQSGLERCYAQ